MGYISRAWLKYQGRQFQKNAEYIEASEKFNDALEAGTGKAPDLWSLLGQVELAQKNYGRAEECFRNAERDAGDSGDGLDSAFYYGLGELYDHLNKPEKCVDYYKKALALKGKPPNVAREHVFYRCAKALAELERFTEAIQFYLRVDNPLHISLAVGDLECDLYTCYLELGQMREADECMRKATASAPIRTDNLVKMAWHEYQQNGNADAAVAQLKECLERKDGHVSDYWKKLGNIHLEQREYEEAEDALLHALELDHDNAAIWWNMAQLYSATDNEEYAMRALEKVTELNPDQHKAWAAMAKMFENQGEVGSAVRIYDKIGDSDPKAMMRRNQILEKAALQLQRTFRGMKARRRVATTVTRGVQRNYGARAPLRHAQAGAKRTLGSSGEYRSCFETKLVASASDGGSTGTLVVTMKPKPRKN